MKTLLIRNLPDEVHAWLEERATAQGHAVEEELVCLLREQSALESPADAVTVETLLEMIERNVSDMPGPELTLEEIQRAIDEGHA